MKVSLIQMNMKLGEPEANFAHAEELIRRAAEGKTAEGKTAEERPDVIVLPETWNVGFFPRENLAELTKDAGKEVKKRLGRLARELSVNLVAGSVADSTVRAAADSAVRAVGSVVRAAAGSAAGSADARGKTVYNTAYIFDRKGDCIASYDKTHLFTPMGEDEYFTKGSRVVDFTLDGTRCGVIICYDLRFAELVRTLALRGIEVLFVPAQWPEARSFHWNTLNRARAIENQIFVACCNSCGTAGLTRYGGQSALIHPFGETIVQAGTAEEIITGKLDLSVIRTIRETINVYRDRRPELYQI